MRTANLRRRVFVDRSIQGRIVGRIAMYWLLYHLVLWHGLFVFRYVQYLSGTMEGKPHQTLGEVYGHFADDYYPLAVIAMVTFPIFLFEVVRMTHRVAGPILRFKNVMKSLLDGEHIPPLKLRPRDLLYAFQDMFNRFTREFQRRGTALATAAERSAEGSERLTNEQARQVAQIVQPAEGTDVVTHRA